MWRRHCAATRVPGNCGRRRLRIHAHAAARRRTAHCAPTIRLSQNIIRLTAPVRLLRARAAAHICGALRSRRCSWRLNRRQHFAPGGLVPFTACYHYLRDRPVLRQPAPPAAYHHYPLPRRTAPTPCPASLPLSTALPYPLPDLHTRHRILPHYAGTAHAPHTAHCHPSTTTTPPHTRTPRARTHALCFTTAHTADCPRCSPCY